jgi:chromosome segregation ATPase
VATFETAAEDLAKKIATLEDILERSDTRFEELRKELSTLGEGVEQDYEALIQQAQAFFAKLQEEREALAREVGEAGQKVSEAETQVGQSRGEAESALAGAKGSLEALTANLGALSPQVETLVAQGAETPSQGLGQMAGQVETTMQQALDGAKEHLQSEVTDELEQMRKDLDQAVEDLQTAATEAGAQVDRAYADFASHLVEATELVGEQCFEAAGKHVKEVVQYAVEECGKLHEEEIRLVGDMANDLTRLLEGFKTELDTERDRIRNEGQEPLQTDMGELTTAVGAAQTALDQVKALLASYTFVQM